MALGTAAVMAARMAGSVRSTPILALTAAKAPSVGAKMVALCVLEARMARSAWPRVVVCRTGVATVSSALRSLNCGSVASASPQVAYLGAPWVASAPAAFCFLGFVWFEWVGGVRCVCRVGCLFLW